MLSTLAARGRETGLIALRLVKLSAGERETLHDDAEMCAVVLSGAVDVTIDGMRLGTAMRAGDVFESAADAAYVPPNRALELVCAATLWSRWPQRLSPTAPRGVRG